jgi:hypothetical protein
VSPVPKLQRGRTEGQEVFPLQIKASSRKSCDKVGERTPGHRKCTCTRNVDTLGGIYFQLSLFPAKTGWETIQMVRKSGLWQSGV